MARTNVDSFYGMVILVFVKLLSGTFDSSLSPIHVYSFEYVQIPQPFWDIHFFTANFDNFENLRFKMTMFKASFFRYSDVIEVQKEIKAASFAECSARTGFNVVEIFERAARIVVANRANGDKVKMGCTNILKSCSIMWCSDISPIQANDDVLMLITSLIIWDQSYFNNCQSKIFQTQILQATNKLIQTPRTYWVL